jgi:hypothetical protein
MRWYNENPKLSSCGTSGAGSVSHFVMIEIARKANSALWTVASAYLRHGIEHILLGYDHLMFVLALILIVRSLRVLLWTVTAFTVAHSITLALATLGVVYVPGPPVEAAIALSIVLLATEILRRRRGKPSLTGRWPWIVAFSIRPAARVWLRERARRHRFAAG